MNLKTLKHIFLDRDGVINIERPNDYVKKNEELIFIEGAIDAIAQLSKKVEHIFIVTNQRGVGRGIMTNDDLNQINQYMLNEIEKKGGRISAIYTCTDVNTTAINRKPNIGMAFLAQKDFPQIKFEQSIMIGNSKSDIEFGNKLHMFTVLVGDKYPSNDKIYQEVNAYSENLYKFVTSFLQN